MKPTERDLQVARAVRDAQRDAEYRLNENDLTAVIAALPEPEPLPVDRDLLRNVVAHTLTALNFCPDGLEPDPEVVIDMALAEHAAREGE